METLPDGKEKICTRVRVSCILSRTRTQQQENSFAFNHWTRLLCSPLFREKERDSCKEKLNYRKGRGPTRIFVSVGFVSFFYEGLSRQGIFITPGAACEHLKTNGIPTK
ncbi:uncharacterized protein LOC141884884 isoform X1 [Acropora palmata]|uniref:uncharacterized protein LOC141884884 isoform X1 n=1 Tax=Acropora palmata TaxID=6131 RepID=UPI003DA0BDE0